MTKKIFVHMTKNDLILKNNYSTYTEDGCFIHDSLFFWLLWQKYAWNVNYLYVKVYGQSSLLISQQEHLTWNLS